MTRIIRREACVAAVVAITLVSGRTNVVLGQGHQAHAPGSVDFPVSCSPAAQAEFNRAVALLHHMTYPRAREAFQEVARIDARCPMAYWGVAMTLFQPLWPTRPGLPERRKGSDTAMADREQQADSCAATAVQEAQYSRHIHSCPGSASAAMEILDRLRQVAPEHWSVGWNP